MLSDEKIKETFDKIVKILDLTENQRNDFGKWIENNMERLKEIENIHVLRLYLTKIANEHFRLIPTRG